MNLSLTNFSNQTSLNTGVFLFERLLKDSNREAEALASGAILEAIIQEGEGNETPNEGDLVYFHFVVLRIDDEETIIYSTRHPNRDSDETPLASILDKAPRLPRAWEMTLLGEFLPFESPECVDVIRYEKGRTKASQNTSRIRIQT